MKIAYDGIDKGMIELSDIGRRDSLDVYSRHVGQDQYIRFGDEITLVETDYVISSAVKGMLKKLADEGIISINPATAVAFESMVPNGTTGTVTTTEAVLTFDVDPTTLAIGDVTVTGATKGVLSGTGLTRTLTLTAISVLDGENIMVQLTNPAGFAFTPTTLSAPAWVADTDVVFSNLTANGSTGAVTTDELTLTFDVEPTGLVAGDITLTGATKGALTGSGTSWTLAISAITVLDGETVNVALANPVGYAITPTNKDVIVWVAP